MNEAADDDAAAVRLVSGIAGHPAFLYPSTNDAAFATTVSQVDPAAEIAVTISSHFIVCYVCMRGLRRREKSHMKTFVITFITAL